ncbi:MAG: Hpt domain-containing protein [Vulcanimicrobiaceae bacterium]
MSGRGGSIDPKVLDIERLLPIFGDDPVQLREIIEEAVTTSASLVERLGTLCAQKSAEATHAAHELKGLAKTVGAGELGTLSERAEDDARCSRWDELLAKIGPLREAHARFSKAAVALGDDIAGSE